MNKGVYRTVSYEIHIIISGSWYFGFHDSFTFSTFLSPQILLFHFRHYRFHGQPMATYDPSNFPAHSQSHIIAAKDRAQCEQIVTGMKGIVKFINTWGTNIAVHLDNIAEHSTYRS